MASLFCLQAALMAPTALSARAEEQPAGPSVAPAPAGDRSFARLRPVLRKRLDLILESMGGENDRFDELRFTEAFIARTPRDVAIEQFRRAVAVSGGFEPLETRQLEPNMIGAWVRAKNNRRSLWILRLAVESVPPHRIDRLDLDAAPIPGPPIEESWAAFDESVSKARFRTAMAAFERRSDGTLHLLHAIDPDSRLAVGTFGTIWAHLALAEFINDGGASWDRGLVFDDSLRSLPPGRTSALEPGAELPLREFARRAARDGDNTAAEHLIAMLGRERIEQARDRVREQAAAAAGIDPPPGGEPYLTTIEFYRLKCGATDLITRYADALTFERQRELLETEVAQTEVDPTLYRAWAAPQELKRVGWLATPRELCHLGARLFELSRSEGQSWALDALRAQAPDESAPKQSSTARSIAGEPGALAGLWIFERADGRAIILAMIMNRDRRAIPDRESSSLMADAIEILSRVP